MSLEFTILWTINFIVGVLSSCMALIHQQNKYMRHKCLVLSIDAYAVGIVVVSYWGFKQGLN